MLATMVPPPPPLAGPPPPLPPGPPPPSTGASRRRLRQVPPAPGLASHRWPFGPSWIGPATPQHRRPAIRQRALGRFTCRDMRYDDAHASSSFGATVGTCAEGAASRCQKSFEFETYTSRLQASGTVDMTNAATLAAILGATATSLGSSAPGSVTVPTSDQLTATAQLLGRVNTLALAASNVQARA